MPEESKPVDPAAVEADTVKAVQGLSLEQDSKDDSAKKDKVSKTEKLKNVFSSKSSSSAKDSAPKSASDPLPAGLVDKLSGDQLAGLLEANPTLRGQLPAGADQNALKEALKKLSAGDLVTGMTKGNNAKDMASYKFWNTQPVTRFDESASNKGEASAKAFEDGPIKVIDKDKVPRTPAPLIDGFEWCEMDLLQPAEMEEVRSLLSGHYVEDDEALFRFDYSTTTLTWALMAPHWKKCWHLGVRTVGSKKLVAFISAIPVTINVKGKTITASEVNFLCVHKKLRSKRLAPVLITEITRRSYVEGIYHGVYTGGTLLPTPVASCRYYHRSLDWAKLHSVGFSPLPHGSTKLRQIAKYKLPETTSTPGLRMMEAKDIASAGDLLRRYLQKMEVSQQLSDEELKHWLLDKETNPKAKDRRVWTYVVEKGGKVTDMISFYGLESSVLNATGPSTLVRAAYLFYYATETAFQDDTKVLSDRLNGLVRDALILAKLASFDVMNALTLLDNPLFLQKQLFGPGNGQLHYYLYNYRTKPVASGVDEHNNVDDKQRRGCGIVML